MASVFISTPAQIVLIDSRTRSGTITLPVTNQIQYRVVSFKDQYGSFSNSTMTLSTQLGEAFDDGTTTKTFSNAFTSINLYAGSTTRWMVMNATQTVQQTISSLITNQLIFGTGAGWAQFGPVQATVLSSIQQTTALGFFSTLSTGLLVGSNAAFFTGTISSLGLSIAASGTFPLNVQGPGIQVNGGGLFLTSTNNVNFNTLAQWFGPTTGLNFAGFGSYVRDVTQRANIGIVAVNNTNTATLMFLSSVGNVGIGTLAPSNYRLNIRGTGTSNGLITWHSAGNDVPFVGWGFDEVADGLVFSRNVGAANLNNFSSVVFARTTGNVGINVGGGPGTTLDVGGTARSWSTVTSSITLASGAGWTTTGALQAVALSSIQLNTAVGYISSLYVGSTTTQRVGPYTAWMNGDTKINRLLIGQASTVFGQSIAAANRDLQMLRASAAIQPGGTAWIQYSDQRIKENIVDADLSRCYNDIKAVPLRRFQYISSFYNAVEGYDRHVLGFVAQEVSSLIPKTAIVTESFGYSNLNLFNIDQLNMALYGAVKKTIADKEVLESTVKGQRFELQTLQGTTSVILSTLEGLQGR